MRKDYFASVTLHDNTTQTFKSPRLLAFSDVPEFIGKKLDGGPWSHCWLGKKKMKSKKKITMATAILKDGSKRTFVVPKNFMTIDSSERSRIVRENIGDTAYVYASVALATKEDIKELRRLKKYYLRKILQCEGTISFCLALMESVSTNSKSYKDNDWLIINEKNMIKLLQSLIDTHCRGVK